MRSSSTLVKGGRLSNNVPLQTILRFSHDGTKAARPQRRNLYNLRYANVAPKICRSCMAKINFATMRQIPGSGMRISGYAASIHTTTSYSSRFKLKPKAMQNFRKAVGNNKDLNKLASRPSRMVLSEKAGRGPKREHERS